MASLTSSDIKTVANRIAKMIDVPIMTNVATVDTGPQFKILYAMDTILHQLYKEFSWTFLYSEETQALTSGTRFYALDDDVDENSIKAVILVNNSTPGSGDQTYKLTYQFYQDFMSAHDIKPDTSVTSTGQPYVYTIYKRQVYLHPVPNDNDGDGWSLLYHCQKNYARGVGTWTNTTTTQIPVDWEHVWDAGVMSIVAPDANKPEWIGRYREYLDTMITDYVAGTRNRLSMGNEYRDRQWRMY